MRTLFGVIMLTAYSPSLADSPAGSSVLVAVVTWLQDVLLGTAATSIAVIAVAAIGFGMLTGRINLRHGATVVLGCFILFGASSIVNGLRQAASGGYAEAPPVIVTPTAPVVVSTPRPVATPQKPFDPYAGASMIR